MNTLLEGLDCILNPTCKSFIISQESVHCKECSTAGFIPLKELGQCSTDTEFALNLTFLGRQQNFISSSKSTRFRADFIKSDQTTDLDNVKDAYYISLIVKQLDEYWPDQQTHLDKEIAYTTIYSSILSPKYVGQNIYELPSPIGAGVNTEYLLSIRLHQFTEAKVVQQWDYHLNGIILKFDVVTENQEIEQFEVLTIEICNIDISSFDPHTRIMVLQPVVINSIIGYETLYFQRLVKAENLKSMKIQVVPIARNVEGCEQELTELIIELENNSAVFTKKIKITVKNIKPLEESIRALYLSDLFKREMYFPSVKYLVSKTAILAHNNADFYYFLESKIMRSIGSPEHECKQACSKYGTCTDFGAAGFRCLCLEFRKGRTCELNIEIASIIEQFILYYQFWTEADSIEQKFSVFDLTLMMTKIVDIATPSPTIVLLASAAMNAIQNKDLRYMIQKREVNRIVSVYEDLIRRSKIINLELEGIFKRLTDFLAVNYFSYTDCDETLRGESISIKCVYINELKESRKTRISESASVFWGDSISQFISTNTVGDYGQEFILITEVADYNNLADLEETRSKSAIELLHYVGIYDQEGEILQTANHIVAGSKIAIRRDSSKGELVKLDSYAESFLNIEGDDTYASLDSDRMFTDEYSKETLARLLGEIGEAMEFQMNSSLLISIGNSSSLPYVFGEQVEYSSGDQGYTEVLTNYENNTGLGIYSVLPFQETRYFKFESDSVDAAFLPRFMTTDFVFSNRIYRYYLTFYYIGGTTLFLIIYLLLVTCYSKPKTEGTNLIYIKKSIFIVNNKY